MRIRASSHLYLHWCDRPLQKIHLRALNTTATERKHTHARYWYQPTTDAQNSATHLQMFAAMGKSYWRVLRVFELESCQLQYDFSANINLFLFVFMWVYWAFCLLLSDHNNQSHMESFLVILWCCLDLFDLDTLKNITNLKVKVYSISLNYIYDVWFAFCINHAYFLMTIYFSFQRSLM